MTDASVPRSNSPQSPPAVHSTSPLTPRPEPTIADHLQTLLDRLPEHPQRKWVERSLLNLCEMASNPHIDRLDWKIMSKAMHDMTCAMDTFSPYRYVRKVAIFGSARTPHNAPEYQLAREFAAKLAELGFMVITGAGDGIMAAGNQGAGATRSFGLNIELPFEQSANPYINHDSKLIEFKYFFTRKLFFLRESDAIALFPGGFGTMDESFEAITLLQTGKFGPAPLVLIQPPGSHYWDDWEAYIRNHLAARGLIHDQDLTLYKIVESAESACQIIRNFYRLYHSSRYVGDRLVIRLNGELSDAAVETLNTEFSDILSQGKIQKSAALPEEAGDETARLPRLVLHFNRSDLGRLHQAIHRINELGTCDSLTHCATRQ